MSQQTIHNNSDLSQLLLFQEQFITLVHSNIYHHQESRQDAILKFEIHYLSEINNRIAQTINTLSQQLITRKIPYELGLRDCFQRLLQADFLPLLRINRYELTKVSLFGFDIYVEPLQAILQILSRIDTIKKRITESAVEFEERQTAESALQEGWDSYLAFADEWKMSFNLYMLQEYLRIGGKSFLKKDREIIFTGISNLYNQLAPFLAAKQNIKLLKQLAELNNALYNFHPSFNYFQLYALLLPLRQFFQPIFYTMNVVLQKCLRTNILTPLLFGLLRHRQDFLRFIAEVDSPVWLPYLNTILSGIAINFKFRILEYEEIIELFEKTAEKAGLLGQIRTEEIVGTLEQGWKDAKEFFISAVKIGFNSGEVQTWKVIQFDEIGPRIMSAILDGMLINPECNTELGSYLFNPQQKLSQLIRKLSDNRLDWHGINSGICQLERPLQNQQQVCNLLRVLSIIKLLKTENEYNLNFCICSILSINCILSKSVLVKLNQSIEHINQCLSEKQANSLTFIKQKVIALHKKYPPKANLQSIIRFYFQQYEPKTCFSTLIEIIMDSTEDSAEILARYVSKQLSQALSDKLVKMRTFEKELIVKASLVNAPYQTHCILSVLVSQLTSNSKRAQDLILKLIKAYPLMSFSLLNFPISQKGRLLSFSTYMIERHSYHQLLKQILIASKGKIESQEKVDLIQVLSYPSIRQQICKRINQVQDIHQLYLYANLLLWVYRTTGESQNNCRQLLHIYLYILQKSTSIECIKKTVGDIAELGTYAFREKLELWVGFLLSKQIEGKFDMQTIPRKRTMKISGSSIYFVNQIPQNQVQQIRQQIKQREISPKNKTTQIKENDEQILGDFWDVLSRLSKLGLNDLNAFNKNQHIIFQEEIKSLCVPELSETILKDMMQLYSQAAFRQDRSLNQAITFAGLNTQNYLRLVEQGLSLKNIEYLLQNRYIARLNTKMAAILLLSTQNTVNILKQMSTNLSIAEQEKIGDAFFLESTLLDSYVQFIEGSEFFVLFNNLNWRLVIDHLSKLMTSCNLSSAVLQYNEYVTITAQPNTEYQTLIAKNGHIFHTYVKLVLLKLHRIFEGPSCTQELELKSVNELTYLNLVVSSLQLKQFVIKLATLHKTMRDRNIPFQNHWIRDVEGLNSTLNHYFPGDVIAPDFANGYFLTNQELLHNHKTEIGLILESYYEAVGETIPQANFYLPKGRELNKVTLKEIPNSKQFIIDSDQCQRQDLLIEKQKTMNMLFEAGGAVAVEGLWDINYQAISKKQQLTKAFYLLGCINALQPFKLPPLLDQMIKRKRLPWEVVKHIRSDEYHNIKSILVQPEMNRREVFFIREGQELIQNGTQIRVNQYNRDIYCQKVALKVIGSAAWKCASQFLKGFTNQKASL